MNRILPSPSSLNLRPLRQVPIVRNPLGTVQQFGQQYEFQSYNADGNIVTRTATLAQFLVGNFSKSPTFAPANYSNLTLTVQGNEARLLASLKLSPVETAKIFQDSIKIDYTLCIRSKQSLPVEFNMLQTPQLSAKLKYNFYTQDETDTATQEDQTLDPLLTNQPVPRFVQLNWDITNTVNKSDDFASRTSSENAMVAKYLNTVRGASTLSNQPVVNSFQSNLASVQPIFRLGQALQLVDTHDLERGFNSTSNARLFKNTAITTVNTNAVDLNTISFNDLILEDFFSA
jgi:hypothetical protein